MMRIGLAAGVLSSALVAAASPAIAHDACDFGSPHPSMPEEFGQYQFIIGDFEVRIRVWTGEAWSEGYQRARWTGRYILGGRAVMEEWFPKDPEDDPNGPGGVNVRMYDAEEGLWKLMWMRNDQLTPTILRSQVKEDGNMHLWRVHPTPEDRQVHFESFDEDNWARFDHVKNEAGEWTPKYKLEAHRLPCGE
jgi:hypothetical protein